MASGYTVKTNTDVLYKNVTQINESLQDIRKRYADIAGLMANMPKYWLGEASDRHTAGAKSMIEDIEPLIQMLEQKPIQLFSIAGLYDNVEEINRGLGRVLDSNVIE